MIQNNCIVFDSKISPPPASRSAGSMQDALTTATNSLALLDTQLRECAAIVAALDKSVNVGNSLHHSAYMVRRTYPYLDAYLCLNIPSWILFSTFTLYLHLFVSTPFFFSIYFYYSTQSCEYNIPPPFILLAMRHFLCAFCYNKTV